MEKWEKTNLLKKLPDNKKGIVAVLLENQRLYNEMITDTGDVAQFKRISIPLVRRIAPGFLAFELASVQPMLGPTSLAYHFEKNKIVETDMVARTIKMKAVWTYEACQDLRSQFNLDAEAELTAILAQEINLEFDRMLLTDLRNNAALKKTIDYSHIQGETESERFAVVQNYVYDLAAEAQKLYGRPFANKMVVSPEMAKVLLVKEKQDDDIFSFKLGISEAGTFSTDKGDITVFTDPLLPTGAVVMAYRGEHQFDAGYVFSPYIMLSQTPVVLDPDSFVPRKGILSRFGVKLVDPTYFSSLVVSNLKLEEDEVQPINGCQ